MQCSNPDCRSHSPYLRSGSLHPLQLEVPDSEPTAEERAFAMRAKPLRFFWLCQECSQQFILTKWTAAGLVLAHRMRARSTRDGFDTPSVHQPTPTAAQRLRWRLP